MKAIKFLKKIVCSAVILYSLNSLQNNGTAFAMLPIEENKEYSEALSKIKVRHKESLTGLLSDTQIPEEIKKIYENFYDCYIKIMLYFNDQQDGDKIEQLKVAINLSKGFTQVFAKKYTLTDEIKKEICNYFEPGTGLIYIVTKNNIIEDVTLLTQTYKDIQKIIYGNDVAQDSNNKDKNESKEPKNPQISDEKNAQNKVTLCNKALETLSSLTKHGLLSIGSAFAAINFDDWFLGYAQQAAEISGQTDVKERKELIAAIIGLMAIGAAYGIRLGIVKLCKTCKKPTPQIAAQQE